MRGDAGIQGSWAQSAAVTGSSVGFRFTIEAHVQGGIPMSKRSAIMAVVAASTLVGCASNSSQIRLRSAQDLNCEEANVHVELTERPYVGVTRYEASGCGETRFYECRARAYVAGVPMGERTCRRTGDAAGPVFSPQSVTF